MNLDGVTVEEALQQVLSANGYYYKVTNQRTIIVIPDQPAKHQQYDELVREGVLHLALRRHGALAAGQQRHPHSADGGAADDDAEQGRPTRLPCARPRRSMDVIERIIRANDKPRAEVVLDIEILEVNRAARQALRHRSEPLRAGPAVLAGARAAQYLVRRNGAGPAAAVQPEHDHAGRQHGGLLPRRPLGRRELPRERRDHEDPREAAAPRAGRAGADAEPRSGSARPPDDVRPGGRRRARHGADVLVQLQAGRRQPGDHAARHLRRGDRARSLRREQRHRRAGRRRRTVRAVLHVAQGAHVPAAARRGSQPARRLDRPGQHQAAAPACSGCPGFRGSGSCSDGNEIQRHRHRHRDAHHAAHRARPRAHDGGRRLGLHRHAGQRRPVGSAAAHRAAAAAGAAAGRRRRAGQPATGQTNPAPAGVPGPPIGAPGRRAAAESTGAGRHVAGPRRRATGRTAPAHAAVPPVSRRCPASCRRALSLRSCRPIRRPRRRRSPERPRPARRRPRGTSRRQPDRRPARPPTPDDRRADHRRRRRRRCRVASGPYTVPISINNASRLSTITLTVTYNPAVLRVRTVQDGTFMRQGGVTASFTPRPDANAGRVDITIARTGDQTGASGAGLLAALIFDAIAPGTTTLTVAASPARRTARRSR